MKIIAIEEHIVDKDLLAATRETINGLPYFKTFSKPELRGNPPLEALRDVDARLRDMDKCGIDMEVISLSHYPQWIEDSVKATHLCRQANERLGHIVHAHPDRLAAFASLPWGDPTAAAKEMLACGADAAFKGAMIFGRPKLGAAFLDDPRYDPIWAALCALDLPVYIHPGFPDETIRRTYYAGINADVDAILATYGFGWHLEPGIQVLRMILAGVFDRFPALKVISGHWGEVTPYFISRFDQCLTPAKTGLRKKISEYYRNNVWVTPSGMYDYDNLEFCIRKFGMEHILFSTDFPYIRQNEARAFIDNAPLSEIDKEKISHLNAEKLLKL